MLSDFKQKIDLLRVRHDQASRTLVKAAARATSASKSLMDNREAITIAQEISREIQQRAHDRIASIVTRCIQTVFEEDIEFRIIFESKANRTEANLVFVKDGMTVDPMTESGGGLVDVAAFAVRLACLMLAAPPRRRLLVLDEPFRFLSANYRPRMRDLILALAKEMNVQFIMVTHITEMQIGTVVEIN